MTALTESQGDGFSGERDLVPLPVIVPLVVSQFSHLNPLSECLVLKIRILYCGIRGLAREEVLKAVLLPTLRAPNASAEAVKPKSTTCYSWTPFPPGMPAWRLLLFHFVLIVIFISRRVIGRAFNTLPKYFIQHVVLRLDIRLAQVQAGR